MEQSASSFSEGDQSSWNLNVKQGQIHHMHIPQLKESWNLFILHFIKLLNLLNKEVNNNNPTHAKRFTS